MNKTKIEWVKNLDGSQGYTVNPVKGLCPVGCSYCYARRMYRRFKWNPEIRYAGVLNIPNPEKPARIFVGSTMELFGDWIRTDWMEDIFEKVMLFPEHTFIFLTKQPQNLLRWSPFPDNCYVGVTATNTEMAVIGMQFLREIAATVKYVSFEPLLKQIGQTTLAEISRGDIDWLIIGAQTKPTVLPRIEWVQEIVEAADKAGIRVFLKDNLKPLFKPNYEVEYPWAYRWGAFRQEMPEEVKQCKGS